MILKELFEKVDKSKRFKCTVEINTMANLMGINDMWSVWADQDRLVSYYVASWYCTDSFVGMKVYFFDDVPVALSTQTGRKSDENIRWVSQELFDEVFNYVLSFKEPETGNCHTLNLEEEILDMYPINFYEQLFDYHKTKAVYQGKDVTVLRGNPSGNENGKYHPETVEIKFEDGTTKWVILEGNVFFKYNLK